MKTTQRSRTNTAEKTPVTEPVRLLVADDDPGIRDIFSIIFNKAGYSLELKSNGADLMNDKYILPDLFIIDKQLSGYDGLEICRYLKKKSNTKNIPVIIISASPDIVRLAAEAGADACLEKPFDIKKLMELVGKYTAVVETT